MSLRWIFILLIVLLILIVAVFASGCNVLKSKQSSRSDSTTVAKNDSAHLKKADIAKRSDSSWWKETIYYGRDTTIYNSTTTVPVNNYYPTQVIREGGTFSKDEMMRLLDSAGRSKTDSTSVKTAEESKSKKTTMPLLLQVALLLVGFEIVKFVAGKFKIVKT